MIESFWFRLLLGHLCGDYLLQNNWMAMQKNKHGGLGIFPCLVHCILYTLAVILFTFDFRLSWIMIVFASHWFIDRYAIAEKYLKLINGRTISGFIADKSLIEKEPQHNILRGSFTVFVYVVADNTMHFVLMFLGWSILN